MAKSMSQQLQEARALIERGWCQGELRRVDDRGEPSYCVVGAIMRVSENRAEGLAIMAALRRHLPVGAGLCRDFALFNDRPETTQAEVLAVFDRALTEVTK